MANDKKRLLCTMGLAAALLCLVIAGVWTNSRKKVPDFGDAEKKDREGERHEGAKRGNATAFYSIHIRDKYVRL